MKKSMLIVFALLLTLSAHAQGSIGEVINEYKHQEGYYSFSVGRGLLWLASRLDPEDDELRFATSKLRKIRVLVSENGIQSLATDFIDAVEKDGFTNIFEMNDGSDVIRCYSRQGRRNYRQLALFMNSSSGEHVVVLLTGSFTYSDVSAICSNEVDWVNI